ncbi:acyltransferase family protein [Variovorax sp. M-6]|uniref:acyltransferase family protein n=1 Tax=Variovorax sp. M-6 TaxID=3233041 RepID=UPI003F96C4C4
MKTPGDARLHFLDGLRGWGSLVVLLAHVFGEGFPINDRVTAILTRTGLFNAGLAVWVFFVVSGFSLAIGFCRRRDSAILANIALGRYVRLAVPILCAALLLYLLFVLGLVPTPEHRLPKFQAFLPVSPTVWDVLRFSLFDVFFAYDFATTLIGPLWTMPFELWGSALVLGTLFVAGRLERRGWLYAVLSVIAYLVNPIYAAFIAGLALAEIHASGVLERRLAALAPLFVVLLLVGWACVGFLPQIGNPPGAYLFVATLLTTASVFGRPIAGFLSGGISRFLGRISFPLYLIHGPLMLAYGNNAYRWVDAPTDLQKLLLNLSIVAVCIGSATLLAPMDRLGIAFAKRFSAFITSRNSVTDSTPAIAEQK